MNLLCVDRTLLWSCDLIAPPGCDYGLRFLRSAVPLWLGWTVVILWLSGVTLDLDIDLLNPKLIDYFT